MLNGQIQLRPLDWLRQPALQLALAGGLFWLCFLHLTLHYGLEAFVKRYPLTDFGRADNWSKASLIDFLVSIFGAFLIYITAWQIVSRHGSDRRLIWIVAGVGLLAALTLLFMYPITATDLFDYVFHSRILVHYGQNPLVVSPDAFKGDRFLRTVTWTSQPTPYGALWLVLTVPGSLLAGDNLILNLYLMKGLVILSYLGATGLIWAILKHFNPSHRLAGTLLFAWNPLVLFETAGNGHNDMLMMFFALLAVYLLVREQWAWVLPTVIAAMLVKYVVAILFLPFLVYCWKAQDGRRSRLRFLLKTGGLCILLVLLAARFYVPLPKGLLSETDFYSLLAVPSLLFNLVTNAVGHQTAKTITVVTSLAIYLPLYALGLRRFAGAPHLRRLIGLNTWLVTAYLVIACMQFQPWFVVWPIALGIWADDSLGRRLLLVFTATALLSYAANFFWIWNIHRWQHVHVNLMFVALLFLPLLLVVVHTWLGTVRINHLKAAEILTKP